MGLSSKYLDNGLDVQSRREVEQFNHKAIRVILV